VVKVVLQRKGLSLVPSDEASQQALSRLKADGYVVAHISQPRNLKHHRLFYALMRKVFENQERFKTIDEMIIAIKVGIKHCDQYPLKNGNVCYIPKSISFEKMEQLEFNEFFDRAINLIIKDIIPNTDKKELLAEVYQML
tara:strand:- start:967 stop:1386 length:420 start_codon:yes stop_codon:yes gene_type:complete